MALLLGVSLLAPLPAHAAPSTRHKVPFTCGEIWSGSTRSTHSPSKKSVDFNRAGDLGAPVVASAPGTVTTAQAIPKGGYGRVVEIDHGNGESSLYAHLDRVDVVVGQSVDVGTQIATVGRSGRVSGAHLHFEQKKGRKIVRSWFEGQKYPWGPVASQNCVDVPLAGSLRPRGQDVPVVYRREAKPTFHIRTGPSATQVIRLGRPLDEPLVGDWNGDGVTDVAVRRPRTGRFYLKVVGSKPVKINYGTRLDRPIAGDWDGDGRWEVGVHRASTATFLMRSATGATTSVRLGGPGSIPVTGDWDGDGTTDVGVYDPILRQFTLRTTPGGRPTLSTTAFGSLGDLPVVGDWDGDGRTEVGTWQPGTASFQQLLPGVSPGVAARVVPLAFGRPRT